MFAAIIVILGISVLILIHEAGHFFAAKKAGLLVEEFGFGFPPRIFSIQKGETRYSFNWLPFGGFVKIYGESKYALEERAQREGVHVRPERSFAHQSAWKRFVIIAAGISINFVFGWLLLSAIFMIGSPEKVLIAEVQEGGPAAAAGIEAGDEVAGFFSSENFIQYLDSRRGSAVEVEVVRDGQSQTIEVLSRADKSQGALGVIISDVGFPRQSFFEALRTGLEASLFTMAQIFRSLGSLVSDLFTKAEIAENVVGPIGIFGVAGQLGDAGFLYLLQLIATISLNLAVLNVIPLPALDGGKLLFIFIEKLKGSPVHYKREFWSTIISFGFLLLLMIVITGRDIVRLF